MKAIFVLLCIVIAVHCMPPSEETELIDVEKAWCMPGNTGGILNICKKKGRGECKGVSSTNTCINIIGGPYVSGFTSGSYTCTIYKEAGCSSDSSRIHSGSNNFPWPAKSYRCPCI
jgi:hypothetical protein